MSNTAKAAAVVDDRSKYANWVFTLHYSIFSEDASTLDEMKAMASNLIRDGIIGDANYCIIGDEICPKTGSPHMQGYVMFEKRRRITELKKIHKGIAWYCAKGDAASNFEYCSKTGNYVEFGERPDFVTNGQRETKRWQQAWDAAKMGERETIDPQILVCHYNSIRSIEADYARRVDDLLGYTCEWIYGLTGTGKSTLARAENPIYFSKNANKWWDGFRADEHPCVILDDLSPDHAGLIWHLKVWLDKFEFTGEIKGSCMQIRPKKIVITSQYTPEEIFNEKDAEAIRRRVTFRHLVKQGVPTTVVPYVKVEPPCTLR